MPSLEPECRGEAWLLFQNIISPQLHSWTSRLFQSPVFFNKNISFALLYCFIDFSFLTLFFPLPLFSGIQCGNFVLQMLPWVALSSISFCHQFSKAFITSLLDYCDRILIGVPVSNFHSLQSVLQSTVNDVSRIQNWLFDSCLKTSDGYNW